MIAYTITSKNKVWMLDDSVEGVDIPQWCYTKEGYHIVEELPQDVLDLINESKTKDESKQAIRDAKSKGKPYTADGPNISFTKDDAMGMLQVKAAFELGVPSTTIEFSNGTKLPMEAKEFPEFAKWFANERNKFFKN